MRTHFFAILLVTIAGTQPLCALAQPNAQRAASAVAVGKPTRSVNAEVPDIDKLFEAQEKPRSANVSIDPAVLQSTRDAAIQVQDRTEEKRRERERERASSSQATDSTAAGTSTSTASGVAAVRSEAFDNAGRQTTGYWIECRTGSKTRVYRSAWDSSRDWFSPAGLGTVNFIAKESITIEEVARKICR